MDAAIFDVTVTILVVPPSWSLNHLPDLGCAKTQRIMFLVRFLA